MTRHALIVGIDRYRDLKPLHLPAADAEAIARVLEDLGDFQVDRLPERVTDGRPAVDPDGRVTRNALERAILKLFLPEGGPAPGTALLFVAGHGLQISRGVAEGYLAAWDTGPDGTPGIPLHWLRRVLKASAERTGGTQSQVVWLDTCHSGALLDFADLDPGTPNRCLIAASRAFEPAYEQVAGGHGVLTGALLKALDPAGAADGLVTNRTLAERIDVALRRETQHCLIEISGDAIALTRAPVAAAGSAPADTQPSTGERAGHPRQRRRPLAVALAAVLAAAAGLAVWQEATREDPVLAARLAQARAFLDTGRYAKALRTYEEALALDPTRAEAREGRETAAILADPGEGFDLEEATLRLQGLERARPRDPHVQAMLGRLAAVGGDRDGAEIRFRRALELDPGQAEAWFGLGVLAQEDGRADAAREAYRRARDLSPANPRYAVNLADLSLAAGDSAGALAVYEDLLTHAPDLLLARLDAGNAARLAGDLRRAAWHHEGLFRSLRQTPGVLESADNAEQWVFDLDPEPVTMDTAESKRAYALLAVSLTRFLKGDREGARGARERALRSPEIGRALAVLAGDLSRLAGTRPDLALSVAAFRAELREAMTW